MPKKEAALYYGFWAVVFGIIVYIGATRQSAPEKITFEKLGNLGGSAVPVVVPKNIQVHVNGAVRRPGVYTLKPDARVHDAIREAGGAKPNANLDEWNLAARVSDGSNLHINSKSVVAKQQSRVVASRGSRPKSSIEITPLRIDVPEEYRGGGNAFAAGKISVEPERKSSAGGTRGKKQLPPEGSVSLNTASSADLQRLPGIGPSTAGKILEYRHEHGGFSAIDELLAVKGIGPKKLDAMRKYLRL